MTPDGQSKRVAVVGSGIAGLSAAYYLSRRHEVHVFERDTRIGGHTNTATVDTASGPLPIDTGFIVHNEHTYPRFCRLMDELQVQTQASDMSFAVTTPGGAYEYSSRGARGFFAQRRNLFSVQHYRLLRDIVRFNREAPAVLEHASESPDGSLMTLGTFLDRGRYGAGFINRYLVPMAGAIWSMSAEAMHDFPVATLVHFMHHHGMLGLTTQYPWRVIRGGSHAYLDPITRPFRGRIRTNTTISSVHRTADGVRIVFHDGAARPESVQDFDEIVFACHGDHVLPLLADPTSTERKVLGAFTTSRNETCLHTDASLLPTREAARASWNYHLGGAGPVAVTYHMNRLQSLDTREEYCVTLNADDRIDPSRVLMRMVYEHPLYTDAAIRAQDQWSTISGHQHTHFCGAYWFYGFHEDGVRSGIRVADALGVTVE